MFLIIFLCIAVYFALGFLIVAVKIIITVCRLHTDGYTISEINEAVNDSLSDIGGGNHCIPTNKKSILFTINVICGLVIWPIKVMNWGKLTSDFKLKCYYIARHNNEDNINQ